MKNRRVVGLAQTAGVVAAAACFVLSAAYQSSLFFYLGIAIGAAVYFHAMLALK